MVLSAYSISLLADDNGGDEVGEDDNGKDGEEDAFEDAEEGVGEEFDDSLPGPSGLCVSVGDSGSLSGPANLCSSSPNFRPICPYSPSPSPSPPHSPSPPSHSTIIPRPVCSPSLPCTSSPPRTSSPVVPSIRSRSRSPDSTSLGHGRGRGRGRGLGSDSDRGRGRGCGRGKGRGRDRSQSPASSTSPTPGGGGRRGRKRAVGSDSGTVGGGPKCTIPVDFPNCQYSFSNPPPFIGDPHGPTFSLRHPESATAFTYFSLLFDDDLLNHIANQTNLYARLRPFRRANYQWTDTNVDELRSFLRIIIASGIVNLPNFNDYWETNSVFSQPGIVKGMSRNHFEQLCGRLHFNDNSLAPAYGTPGYDKLYKIRPVIDAVCDKSITLYNLGQNISVDEAMVKFKGRSSLKQYQPLKPIKRGFKIWCAADSRNGYVGNFVVYTGKSGDGLTTDLGYKVVMEACKDFLGKGYRVYCDNYFTSVHLAADLLEHGTTLVGTTRPDKVDFPKDIVNKGAVAGDSRGIAVSTVIDDKIHCFVWLDRKPVFFVDTLFGCTAYTSVYRGLSDGRRVQIMCPEAG